MSKPGFGISYRTAQANKTGGDFIEVTWHDLNENNLTHSYDNGDGTSDLQFKVKGKTVFVRNIPTPKNADGWYWNDGILTKELTAIEPEQIEVR